MEHEVAERCGINLQNTVLGGVRAVAFAHEYQFETTRIETKAQGIQRAHVPHAECPVSFRSLLLGVSKLVIEPVSASAKASSISF